MENLIDHLGWLLGKWHQQGVHSITREDWATLERLYLEEKVRREERDEAIVEFVNAMNAPRGDAADRRRSAAMKNLRAAAARI